MTELYKLLDQFAAFGWQVHRKDAEYRWWMEHPETSVSLWLSPCEHHLGCMRLFPHAVGGEIAYECTLHLPLNNYPKLNRIMYQLLDKHLLDKITSDYHTIVTTDTSYD